MIKSRNINAGLCIRCHRAAAAAHWWVEKIYDHSSLRCSLNITCLDVNATTKSKSSRNMFIKWISTALCGWCSHLHHLNSFCVSLNYGRVTTLNRKTFNSLTIRTTYGVCNGAPRGKRGTTASHQQQIWDQRNDQNVQKKKIKRIKD